MNERYQLRKADPAGFKELWRLESYFDSFQWIKPILYLVKINQCAYCIIKLELTERITLIRQAGFNEALYRAKTFFTINSVSWQRAV